MRYLSLPLLLLALLTTSLPQSSAAAEPSDVLDLATVLPGDSRLTRIYGSSGNGSLGLPVAGGGDVDGDGHQDAAFASFQADPGGVENAGEVHLFFGNGTLGESIDTAVFQPRVLRFIGEGLKETAGSEIWIDDVTGDGVADLLICRQNYTPEEDRIGAGALTLVVGSPALRDRAAVDEPISLGAPPNDLTLTTWLGAEAYDRLGIWVRTGDVTGDGIADIVVGADQASEGVVEHHGAVYVIRGGAHLVDAGTIDLQNFGSTALSGHQMRIEPPPFSTDYHFGATTQVADLDGNGRGEILVAATLFRGGAFLTPAGAPVGTTHSAGGTDQGTLFIAWDDNIPAGPWPDGFLFDLGEPPGSTSVIDGGPGNVRFGEEILGGLDYNGDGRTDLFVGDIAGIGADGANGNRSGTGHVFYDAAILKGREVDLDALPSDITVTTILGPILGALGGDTAAQGDFDGDGLADLAFAAPHGFPDGRRNAGQVFVLYGRPGGWPSLINTRDGALPELEEVRIVEIQGANGDGITDTGDTLAYSAAVGDLDGDGRTDLVTNEMVGNGLAPGTLDVGNLIILSGAQLTDLPPPQPCVANETALCLNGQRFRAEVTWRDFADRTGVGTVVPAESDDSGLFWFFSADNWEMLVKVINGCDFNDRVWVFAAAITDVEYTLRVTDTVTGAVQEYGNALGNASRATTDTGAFDSCP